MHSNFRHTPETAQLEKRMELWRRTAVIGNPTANGDYIRTVCEEIVRRAQILSRQSPLNFLDVAVFLLDRSEAWVMGGLPINEIGKKMPKNLTDLGTLKLTEGSAERPGGPLTAKELKPAIKASKTIIH